MKIVIKWLKKELKLNKWVIDQDTTYVGIYTSLRYLKVLLGKSVGEFQWLLKNVGIED